MLCKCWAKIDSDGIVIQHFIFDREVTTEELDSGWQYVPYVDRKPVCVGFRHDDDQAPRQTYDVQISPEPLP